MSDALALFIAIVGMIGTAMGIIAAWYAVVTARRAIKAQDVEGIVAAIVASKTLKQHITETAQLAAADRVQVLIHERLFMPRELQERDNKEIFRRLSALEQKVDDVPQETANAVMLLIQRRNATT